MLRIESIKNHKNRNEYKIIVENKNREIIYKYCLLILIYFK